MRQPALVLFCLIILLGSFLAASAPAQNRPIDGIQDNSFLIEEAYNQEPGTIQHIFNAVYTNDQQQRGWAFSFIEEWPLFSEDHQISLTVPSYHLREQGQRQNGIGDVLLNYRYQLTQEADSYPALAPRFSLILPTGSRDKGTGDGVVGYQWNLPASKKVSQRIALHANLGLTYLPKTRVRLDAPGRPLSAKRSLLSYNLGGSAVYALTSRIHLMLEWAGMSEQSLDDQGQREREFKSFLSPGVRAAVINAESVQSVMGLGLPIGLNRRSEDYGAFLYFSLEHKIF
jgi:hypothetical protein